MRIAVHVHMHYTDLMDLMAGYLGNIPFSYDLIITITNPNAEQGVRAAIRSRAPKAKLKIVAVTNRGRDVKPLYTDLSSLLKGYDIIGHVHSKKSAFNGGATSGWLEYLLDGLMGSEETVRKIFDVYRRDPAAGLIYPATYHKMPYWANTWLSNRGWAEKLGRRLKIGNLPSSYFSYPVGNMFWARVDAIRPLLCLDLQERDFPEESGQTDGEIMHALERMVAVAAVAGGYNNYVINQCSDKVTFSDQREGIDFSGYHSRSLQQLKRDILQRDVKVVCFDIFDTLMFRCLTDPADLFELMQTEVEKAAGFHVDFKQIRREADSHLRSRIAPGRDVTLAAIYVRIGEVLNLSVMDTERLKSLELRLEWKFMRARSSMVEMMNFAYQEGKQVVLASDMYLEKDFVENLLRELGIIAYHTIYLSSDIGRRKDNRTMFPYLLEREGIGPHEMIHVGDNEQSDLQVPADLGIRTFHVMRPKDLFLQTSLARAGYPGPWDQLSLFCRITLGLQFVRQFDDPFPFRQRVDNGGLGEFGYCYFGPVLLAFISWIADNARKDNISTLYFLARDGDILIRIYTLLKAWLPAGSAHGTYLEVSRRSIGVAFADSAAHLDKLLQPEYSGGPLKELIFIRLGIDLALYPGIDVRQFGFNSIQSMVFIPADLVKIKRLARHLLSACQRHFQQEKLYCVGYLSQLGFFDEVKKAVVDIGYSGTMQRILNEASEDKAVDGYYMVLYQTFETIVNGRHLRAKGLFGDRIDPYLKKLSIDRYSLFYEMVLSSVKGPVVNYTEENGIMRPVYAEVSPEEGDKLQKLPLIHDGILEYCRDILVLLDDHRLVKWKDHQFLLAPFQHFLENPTRDALAMLSGYTLDDYYCGQGILYWAPCEPQGKSANDTAFDDKLGEAAEPFYTEANCLWKKFVPYAPIWSGNVAALGGGTGFGSELEYEIFNWYQEQYEVLPKWYKRIGHLFKIIMGRKRIRIFFEDVGYVKEQPSKVQEIQAWYDKEYEVLPLWYKRFGQLIRVAMKKRSWGRKPIK